LSFSSIMDRTGEHHKAKLGSEGQKLHVLPHMHITDPKQMQ
jgi:hypothetical protein